MSYLTPLWNAWKAAAAVETQTERAAPPEQQAQPEAETAVTVEELDKRNVSKDCKVHGTPEEEAA